jgi:hypothetical protein
MRTVSGLLASGGRLTAQAGDLMVSTLSRALVNATMPTTLTTHDMPSSLRSPNLTCPSIDTVITLIYRPWDCPMTDYMKFPAWIRTSVVSVVVFLLLTLGYEISANYVIWALFAIVTLFVSLGSSNKIHVSWNKFSWQVITLLTVSAMVVFATISALLIPKITDATQFMGAFYASWVASLAFFVVIVIVATIITMSKPEKEPFNTRARILFHNETGNHIEYFIRRLTEILEHYA